MDRNAVKKGQSLFSVVICRKRGAFNMQFHLIKSRFNLLKNVCKRIMEIALADC